MKPDEPLTEIEVEYLFRIAPAGCRADRVEEAELKADGYEPVSDRNQWGARWWAKRV